MKSLESRIVTNGIDRTEGGEGLIIYDLEGNKIRSIPGGHNVVSGALSTVGGVWHSPQKVSSINQLSDGRLLCAYRGDLVAIDTEAEEFEHATEDFATKAYEDIYCAKELSNGDIVYSSIKQDKYELISKLEILESSIAECRTIHKQEFHTSLGVKPIAVKPFPNDKLLFFGYDNKSKSYYPRMFDVYTNQVVDMGHIEGKRLLDFTAVSNEEIAYSCGGRNCGSPGQLRIFNMKTSKDKLILEVSGPILSIAPFSDGRLLCGGMFNREPYGLKDRLYSFCHRKSKERVLHEKGCDLSIIDPKTYEYTVLSKGICNLVSPIF